MIFHAMESLGVYPPSAVVKISSRWFSYTSHASVMGILSLSFLWGESVVRAGMDMLIGLGLGWRGLFAVGAGPMLERLPIVARLLRESPTEVGLPEPETNPRKLFGASGIDPTPGSLGSLLAPMLLSPAFGLVCVLSFGLTLVRETFNLWTSTYFVEAVGMIPARAASLSSLFPLAGVFSVLLAG